MKRKVFAMVLAVSIGSGLFAQKYEPFDMLVGLNLGMGITPSFSGLMMSMSENEIPHGNYALIFDVGLSYDFYLFNWLSFNTGLFFHPDLYIILDQNLKNVENFTDVMATPLCLTIPLMAHINVPILDWLYAGIGLSLNFPLVGMLDNVMQDQGVEGFDSKGPFFVGLPIDIGFDFVKAGKGGGRFFIRITPEFHEKGTTVPIGFMWQINNWIIFRAENGS
jgi:hypothetical protein